MSRMIRKSSFDSKIKIISLIVVVALIAIFAIIIIKKNSNNENNNNHNNNIEILSEKIQIDEEKYEYGNANYDVLMLYPQVNNMSERFKSYFNNKIFSELDYKSVYAELTSGLEDKSNVGRFVYSVTFDRYNCYDYISLIVHQNIQLGSDRKIQKQKMYVINVRSESTAVLQDVFANKIGYKQKVIDYINDYTFKNRIEVMGGNGLKTLPDTQSFYIINDKLHIYFEAAEIAPASIGAIDIEMPYTLKDGLFVY